MTECTTAQAQKPATSTDTRTPSIVLQRKCSCGGIPGVDGECVACRKKRLILQRRATNQAEPTEVPSIVHDVLRSSGQPLDQATRAFMEPRFGHDFSRVRVHTDARAAESARAVSALAYTVGPDVVFGAGQYAPKKAHGQQLLAHELAHVVQQGQARSGGSLSAATHARSEAEARRAASAILDPGVRTPLPLSPAAFQVACDNGKRSGKKSFKVTDSDMQYLQSTVRQLMNEVDDDTRSRILRNDTVAVGLVVDPDGDPTLVYTAAQNRTYPSLRKAADKLGIARWTATPRAEGRGAVGAPGDAEQIMFEAADTNHFRVAGMAVTRAVCPDCAEATRSAQEGGVPVVHVHIPLPKAPTSGPKGGGGEGPAGVGGAKPKTTPKGGAAPAEEPHVAPPAGKGAPETPAAPHATPKVPPKVTPATPHVPEGGEAPSGGLAKGGARAGARGAGLASGGGTHAKSIGGAVAVAVVDAALQIIVQRYVQKILDEKNAEAIEKDLRALEPKIEAKAKAQEARLKELASGGQPAFITVKLRIRWQTDTSGQLGGGTAYMGMDLEDLRFGTTKLDKLKRESVQHGLAEGMLRQHFGNSEEFWSFSIGYPDLQVVSQPDESAPPAGCFIATACYGSPDAPEVVCLRAFRDRVLMLHGAGRAFVRAYYAVSPPLADALRTRPVACALARYGLLMPTIAVLRGLDNLLGWNLGAQSTAALPRPSARILPRACEKHTETGSECARRRKHVMVGEGQYAPEMTTGRHLRALRGRRQ